MDAANVGTAEVEAAIICFYREPARAAEANAYLVAFQQSDSAWEIAEQLLTSTHADVSHFAACSLHQQAKRSASARSTDVLQSQCRRLLGTVGSMPSNLVRSQLCLAVSVLAASLFAADTGGPAALCASAVFMALPPSTKIELLAALPQACPLHHEQLRVLLSHVLSLLQAKPCPAPCTPSIRHALHPPRPTPCTPYTLHVLDPPARPPAIILLARHKRGPTRLSSWVWRSACGHGSPSASTYQTSPTARCGWMLHAHGSCRPRPRCACVYVRVPLALALLAVATLSLNRPHLEPHRRDLTTRSLCSPRCSSACARRSPCAGSPQRCSATRCRWAPSPSPTCHG